MQWFPSVSWLWDYEGTSVMHRYFKRVILWPASYSAYAQFVHIMSKNRAILNQTQLPKHRTCTASIPNKLPAASSLPLSALGTQLNFSPGEELVTHPLQYAQTTKQKHPIKTLTSVSMYMLRRSLPSCQTKLASTGSSTFTTFILGFLASGGWSTFFSFALRVKKNKNS